MASRREQAGLPLYPKLRQVTLQTMRKVQLPASRSEVYEHVANALNLTDEQRSIACANGTMPEYMDRVGWALSFLKQANAVDNVTRGSWSLTEEGTSIDFDEVERRVAAVRAEYHRNRSGDGEESGTNGVEAESSEETESNWVDELLDRLHAISPTGFERLAKELLLKAGFDEVEVTRASRDGGIDGVGTYRPSGLISFRTSFQCKRWKDAPVRAPDVQAFQGAIQGQSDRGIFITTSYFTKDAESQASRPGALPVDLIPGSRLAELLKEHALGVRTEMVEQVTIDTSYFDQFEAAQ